MTALPLSPGRGVNPRRRRPRYWTRTPDHAVPCPLSIRPTRRKRLHGSGGAAAPARKPRERQPTPPPSGGPGSLLFFPRPGTARSANRPRRAGRAAAEHRWVTAADCRTALPGLSEHSVSVILTDPPYFTDRMGAEWNHRDLRARVKDGVIGGLPVGMKFDRQQGRDLYDFLLPVAEQWMRVLRPGGFALCFSHPRLTHRTTAAIEDAGFEIRDLLAWKHEGQPKAFTQDHFVRRRNLPARDETRILRALGGRKTPQLKPQMEMIVLAQAPREGTFVDNWMTHRAGLIDVSSPFLEPDRFPGTLLSCPKPKERFGHLTAKPVALLRHLIRIFTAPGSDAVVLDPFAGSGSTGVAARLEGRGFLGFEIDPAMARIAERRIEAGES